MQATPANLSKYLGIPLDEEALYSKIQGYQEGNWLDHLSMEQNDEGAALISEPYHMNPESVKEMLRLCEDFNLDFLIDGKSTHNPGRCFRITLWRGMK